MKKILSLALILMGISTFGTHVRAEDRAALFEDGEIVCFLGDSITARGSLQTNVSDYYLTRLPDRTVRFVNAGRSGDSANGSLRRLEKDVIDLHGPMTELNAKQQETDPKWTIVGSDRVHPGAPGFLMMTWLFLKAQGAPAIVSKVIVDAAASASTDRVKDSANAEVSSVKPADGGVSFTVLAKARRIRSTLQAKPCSSSCRSKPT